MSDLIRIELFKNIDSFVNELSLTIDYLDTNDIQKYIIKIKEDQIEFDNFIKYTHDTLNNFETQLSSILFSKKKINTTYYIFLNDIVLFNNLLHFKIFEHEVKNTKRDFVKYLYNIYMSIVFINGGNNQELKTFIKKIENESKNLKDSDIKKERLKHRRNAIHELKLPSTSQSSSFIPSTSPSSSSMHPSSPMPQFDLSKLMSGTNGSPLNDFMSSILGNTDILNIATDISKQMHDQQIDPMAMLSGLMSGNNNELQGIVTSIQEKVDIRINSGEINKAQLEEQSESIIKSLGNIPGIPGMPDIANMANITDMANMTDFIKKMTENMPKPPV